MSVRIMGRLNGMESPLKRIGWAIDKVAAKRAKDFLKDPPVEYEWIEIGGRAVARAKQ